MLFPRTSFLVNDYYTPNGRNSGAIGFDLDKIVKTFFYDSPDSHSIPPWGARLLPFEEDAEAKEVEIQIAIAGFEPGDVTLSHNGKVVTVRGENKRDNVIEKFRKSFVQSFAVGEHLDLKGICADLANGLLTIKIPLREKEDGVTEVPIG